MTIPQPIDWTADGAIRILDQTLLPGEERYLDLATVDAVAEAIRTLRVRGAPLIGIAAAMGVTLAARGRALSLDAVCAASKTLGATRPTAVNLHWALARMERRAALAAERGQDLARALRDEADAIWDEDRAMCARIGAAGAELVGGDALILTHCNAGALATGGMGTALAPVYTLHQAGKRVGAQHQHPHARIPRQNVALALQQPPDRDRQDHAADLGVGHPLVRDSGRQGTGHQLVVNRLIQLGR